VSTALAHEAHNPQTIIFNGSWYIFHIGTANSPKPALPCDNSYANTMNTDGGFGKHKFNFNLGSNDPQHARRLVPSHTSTQAVEHNSNNNIGCPVAPAGYSVHPAHCVGPNPHSQDCSAFGSGQISTGCCNASDANGMALCVAKIGSLCDATAGCHSFALRANNADCAPVSGFNCTGAHYKLMVLGESSVVSNTEWVSYAKPGQGPMPPPSPPSPSRSGGTIHRAAGPRGVSCVER
jgi:hypothetical protein